MISVKEKKELKEFVNRYKEIETSIEVMQKTIESLAVKRNNLFDELDNLKQKEEGFMNRLIKKYGPSEITPFKLLQIYQETDDRIKKP
jgi:peptidoglycan hydrolase CwlO-like protein